MPITINGDGTITGLSAGGLTANTVQEATIADNQVTLAKMAGGTDGQIITYDANGDPVAVGPGTDGQVLTSTGAGSPPAFEANSGVWSLVGSANTTVGTGTSHTFTGISSSARQVLYLFRGISFNGDQNYSIRIGPSGGVVTTGYLNNNVFWGNSSQGTQSTTDCFRWNSTNAAAYTGNGYVHFTYFNDDIWQAFGWFSPSNATGTSSAHYLFNGSVDCGTALERIELYPQSSANLDAGTVTVYEVT